MKRDYKVISEFECCGKPMVTVKIGNNVHVMTYEDWETLYRRMYHENKYKNVSRSKKRNMKIA